MEQIWKEALAASSKTVNLHIWWENLNNLIIIYFKEKGKENAQNISGNYNRLVKEFNYWTTQFMTNKQDFILGKMEELQIQIDKINENRAAGVRLRSKVFNIASNEKPTKYFFRKAQSRKSKSLIAELKTNNGTIATGLALLEVGRRYYKKLYCKKKTNLNSQQAFFKYMQSLLKGNLKNSLKISIELKEFQEAIQYG
jgi:hypothetical protein